MEDYEIESIDPVEGPAIYDFLKRSFFVDEPLTATMDEPPGYNECICIKALEQRMSKKAVDQQKKIIGICITLDFSKYPGEQTVSENMKKLKQFFQYCEESSKIEEEEGKLLTLQIIAVDRDWRRKGICRQLINVASAEARDKGYESVKTICTSLYSANLVRKLGWKKVFSLKYSEYRGSDKNPIFVPPSPHTEVVVYTTSLT